MRNKSTKHRHLAWQKQACVSFFSHLCGIFERGSTPVEVPEMTKAAKLIIERIKEDKAQFEALLRSIGKPIETETILNSDAQ